MSNEAKKAAIAEITKADRRYDGAAEYYAGRGWDAHAEHMAAIRLPMYALIQRIEYLCAATNQPELPELVDLKAALGEKR